MARPKGSKNKKGKPFKHDAEKVATLLGISLEEAQAKIAKQEDSRPEKLQYQAEATLAYAYNRGNWHDRKCKACGKTFAADYRFVAYCSMACRKDELEALGLVWNPTRSEDQRWEALGLDTPGIVPPAAYEALRNLARKFAALEDNEPVQHDSPAQSIPEPNTNPSVLVVQPKEKPAVVFR